jgi:hypothetical protein
MLHQRQVFMCPCCGGFIGEAAPLDAISESRLSDSQKIIFNRLAKTVGRDVTAEALVSLLYDHRSDGGPDRPHQTVSAFVVYLNKRIRKHGWVIISRGRGRYNSAKYRLIPLEAGA